MVRRARSQGLIDPAPVVAVDATGLETRHVSAHFGHRRGNGKGRRQWTWPKLTTALHTRSHLLLAAVPGTGPSQDSPDFTPAMHQAAVQVAIDTVLGDAGYDAEHNHRLCRETLGIRQTVICLNRRNTGRRFPKAAYHQRWHVESGFSQHKRRLGSALTARNGASQGRELILRVLKHNIMLLAETA